MSENFETVTENIGGSIFWTPVLLTALAGTSLLSIWSFFNDNITAAILSFIFGILILSSVAFTRMEIVSNGTWTQNSVSFMLGFILWGALVSMLGGAQNNIFSLSSNNLFATIASELPRNLEFLTSAFIIPIAEEAFWMIAIPSVVLFTTNKASDKLPFMGNPYLQLILILVISSLSFAFFHVGKLFLWFLVAAVIFRSILIISVLGDMQFDWIPGIKLVASFALGAHIANNWFNFGFVDGLIIIGESFWTWGFIVAIFFAAMIGTSLNWVGLKVGRSLGDGQ